MKYTLKNMFEEAKVDLVSPHHDFFEGIELRHPSIPDFRPRWHQITGLNLTFVYTRSGLWDEQGTGKTLPIQAALIWHATAGNRPIALMPPILTDQFIESFYDTFHGIEEHVQMVPYRGTLRERGLLLKEWKALGKERMPIVIMTPEIFRKEFSAFTGLGSYVLACDECKYWANPETKTYQAIETFLGDVGQRVLIGMNGTPAKNDLSDLYGYVRLLTPSVYRSKLHFYSKHVVEKKVPIRYKKGGALKTQDVKIIDSFKNIGELRDNLYAQSRRVEKKDVIEIPPKQIIEFPFRLNQAHEDSYEMFCTARFLEFEDGTAISGEQTATLRQIAAQSVVDTSILQVKEESAVLEALEELFEQIDVKRNKVSVAAYYNKTIEIIAERFKHLNPAVIYGPKGSKNLKEADRFKREDSCRISILNYQSGGVGLNFQDVCHYGISAEPTTVPGDFDQWTDRMHRSGQKEKTTIYVLSPKRTIWIKMIQSMLKKKSWNKSVVSVDALKKELRGE